MEKHKYIVAMLVGIVLAVALVPLLNVIYESNNDKSIVVGNDAQWSAPAAPLTPTDIFNRGY